MLDGGIFHLPRLREACGIWGLALVLALARGQNSGWPATVWGWAPLRPAETRAALGCLSGLPSLAPDCPARAEGLRAAPCTLHFAPYCPNPAVQTHSLHA